MPPGEIRAALLLDNISAAYLGFGLVENASHVSHQLCHFEEYQERSKRKVSNVAESRFQTSISMYCAQPSDLLAFTRLPVLLSSVVARTDPQWQNSTGRKSIWMWFGAHCSEAAVVFYD